MKLKPLYPLALSLSLLLVACVPQTQIQPTVTEALMPGHVPITKAQATERVSFRFELAQANGFRSQFADLSQAASVSLSLVGDGISGTRSSRSVRLSEGQATVSIDDLPIQDGKLRVVTAIAYDSEGNPLQAFVAKGFYTSRRGVTEHRLTIDRPRWLVGSALELLLASDPAAASAIDHATLQSSAEAAFGLSDGRSLIDPTLFNPTALASLLAGASLPDTVAITGTRVGPGVLPLMLSTSGGGNFGEDLTVRVNDPNSDRRIVPTGSVSPQNLSLDLSPGTWTLEILTPAGEVVATQPVLVDADGNLISGGGPLTLNGIVETPVIESISSSALSIGSTLIITGRGFSFSNSDNLISFGTTETLPGGVATTTELRVLVPAGISGDQPVTVTRDGQTSNSTRFAVVPVISAIEPPILHSGLLNQSITLIGTGFGATGSESSAHIGGLLAPDSGSSSQTEMTVTLPSLGLGPQAARVTVGSQTSPDFGFNYGDILVNTYITSNQNHPAVAMDADGDFVVAWQSNLQDAGSMYSIYAQRYNAAGLAQGPEFRVTNNTATEDNKNNAAVAMDADGNFVIAWQNTRTLDIYARRYDASGTALDNEILVNTYTTGSQSFPAISMNADGAFVITWSGQGNGDDSGIFARRYTADGNAPENEFQVNAYITNFQSSPSVAMGASGDFVIAWASSHLLITDLDIYVRRFNAAGQDQGSEFRVNEFTSTQQNAPKLAMDASGDFVIAWDSDSQDGSGKGIFARRYNASGLSQAPEFQVNTYSTSNQVAPAVAMDAVGNFLITWTSNTQDGSVSSIYAQRYQADGQPRGTEFLVNAGTSWTQFNSEVAMNAAGHFAATWVSIDQDGSSFGIFAQTGEFGPP